MNKFNLKLLILGKVKRYVKCIHIAINECNRPIKGTENKTLSGTI